MEKTRASKNRTITLSEEEKQRYLSRCIVLNEPALPSQVLGKVILGETMQTLPHLPSRFVDLLILDPPYNLDRTFSHAKFSKMQREDYMRYIRDMLMAVRKTLKDTATVYFCSDWTSSAMIEEVVSEFFFIRNRITWQREKGRGAKANWKNAMEDIWFATVSKRYRFNVEAVKLRRRVMAPYRVDGRPKDWEKTKQGNFRDTCPSNLWDDMTIPYWSMPENTDHPTQKPEKLMARLILASSCPGDVVFDPFLGSGTTAVAARKLGRRFTGIEREADYCALACKRLEMAEINPSIQGYSGGVFWERNTGSRQAGIRKKQMHGESPADHMT